MPPTAAGGGETLRYKIMGEKKRLMSPPAVFPIDY
jgi:hypothetical protein